MAGLKAFRGNSHLIAPVRTTDLFGGDGVVLGTKLSVAEGNGLGRLPLAIEVPGCYQDFVIPNVPVTVAVGSRKQAVTTIQLS